MVAGVEVLSDRMAREPGLEHPRDGRSTARPSKRQPEHQVQVANKDTALALPITVSKALHSLGRNKAFCK